MLVEIKKQISIPDNEFCGNEKHDLETILIYGADHGVDVGDVIQYKGQSYEIILIGFLPIG